MNIIKKSFDDLIIIENDETKNRYRTDDDEKYMNFNRYKEDDEYKNEYKKNKENKKNKSYDDDNDNENIIMIKIIELFD